MRWLHEATGWLEGGAQKAGDPEGLLHAFRYKTVPQLRVLWGK